MKICQPFTLSDLALQLSLVIHTSGLWLQENGNISSLSCVTEVHHVTTTSSSRSPCHTFTL